MLPRRPRRSSGAGAHVANEPTHNGVGLP